MTKHKQQQKKKAKSAPKTPGGWKVHGSPGGDDLFSPEDDARLQQFIEANPEISAPIFEALKTWGNGFIAEHGRQPNEQDVDAWITEVLADPDGEDAAEAGAEAEDPAALVHCCAWYGKKIPEDTALFGMGLMLPPAIRKSQAKRPVVTLEFRMAYVMARARGEIR